jgi:hypothetical protein
LYEAISKIFPTVKAIYIRQTGHNKKKSQQAIENLETMDVAVCYFKNSSGHISF